MNGEWLRRSYYETKDGVQQRDASSNALSKMGELGTDKMAGLPAIQGIEYVLTGFDAVTVEVQEKVGRHIGSALVSVHKRVVFRDAEQVGGSENEKIILAIEMSYEDRSK